jgi:7 transmembrane receptor (rhodopsin family)
VTGTAANGFLLFVLFYHKLLGKNTTNKFICNQTILDGFSCVGLTVYVTFQWTVGRGALPNGAGGWLGCFVVNGLIGVYFPAYASHFSLVVITIERYAMVVHPLAHRNYFRPWMVAVGLIAPWIDGFVVYLLPLFLTSRLNGDRCFLFTYWATSNAPKLYFLFVLLWQFTIPVLIIVFCYIRIIAVVRRQTSVVGPAAAATSAGNRKNHRAVANPVTKNMKSAASASTTTGSSAITDNEQVTSKTERKIIRTMITVIIVFVVCWLPLEFFEVVYTFRPLRQLLPLLNVFNMVAYISLVVNPIVYGAHFDVIRRLFKDIVDLFTKTGDGNGIVQQGPSFSGEYQAGGHALFGNRPLTATRLIAVR